MSRNEAGGFFFRSLNRRKSFGHCLFRLISPPMKYPPQAVMGGSSPCTPEPGDFSRGCRPASAENDSLDHFQGASPLLDLIERQTCRRCASGPAAESRQPGCKASGESQGIIRRESSLSLSDFPGLSMGQKPTNDRLPKQMADVAVFFPWPLFAKYGSRGIIPLVGVWGEQPQRSPSLVLRCHL